MMNLQEKFLFSPFILLLTLFSSVSTLFAQDVDVKSMTEAAAKVIAKPLNEYQRDANAVELKRVVDNMLMKAPYTDKVYLDTKLMAALPASTQASVFSDSAILSALKGTLPKKSELYKYFSGENEKNVNGLLGPLNIANLLQKDVMLPDEESKPKMRDLINFLTDPYPKPFNLSSASGDIASKESLSDKLTTQALLSVPMNALSEMVARRANIGTEDVPNSTMKIMRNQAESRMTNPTWISDLSVLSQEALLREIAYMQASNLYMQYQNYRLNEQMVSLLSVVVSTQVQFAPMLIELAKQLKAAEESATIAVDEAQAKADAAAQEAEDE